MGGGGGKSNKYYLRNIEVVASFYLKNDPKKSLYMYNYKLT